MSSCAPAISACLDSIRGCADKARLGCAADFVTTQVTIRTQRWTGGRLGIGSKVISDLVMPKAFPVRQLRQSEISSSGGRYTQGDVIVEGISPVYTSHGGGGFTPEQLDPKHYTPNPDTEVIYILTGETAGHYTLVSSDTTSDPTEWSLVLRNTRITP